MRDPAGERRRMVRRDLASRGITDRRVLAAMARIPRDRFLEPQQAPLAYADRALAIGHGQTISQPYIVALMVQAARLTRHSRVLEVGTGSGYLAAILGHLAGQVWTIERHPALAARARECLAALGQANVHVVVGNGVAGYPAAAPFDAILVSAAGPDVPPALHAQLAGGGRLVLPVGPPNLQELLVVRAGAEASAPERLGACVFVPLVNDGPFPATSIG